MLWGICHGYPSHSPGAFGRSLLGYQTLRAAGTPPVGSDSLKTRMSPNIANGDIYIVGVGTPYRFQLRQDGTYYYDAGGDEVRQLIAVAAYEIATGLVTEGALAINDDAPRPVGATLFNTATFAYNLPVSFQLQGTDLQGDAITFTVQAGTVPTGTSISSSGLFFGTPTAYGAFGFTVRLSDAYGAFTDSIEQVTIAAVLPDFVKTPQLLAQAEATVAAMGLSFSASPVASALPLNTVVSQSPPAGTVVTGSTTVNFTYSDGSLFSQPSNVFPSNIAGLTWNGTRSMLWRTSYQEAVTGKVTTFGYQKFPIIEWTLVYNLLNQAAAQDDLRKLEGLFTAKQGSATPFLYVDPTFNSVTAEPFGTGDGSTKAFQLIAKFANSGSFGIAEIIQNVQTTPAIQVFDNGTLVSSANYSVGVSGIVTFNSAPVTGHALTWTGSFYYQCRFEMDSLDPSEFFANMWELQTVKFRSVLS